MNAEGSLLTREQLYELVWSEPISIVAPRLGLSDRGLAKACERLHVPRPGRGYWEKKRSGKRVRQPPLRPLPEGFRGRRFVETRVKVARVMHSDEVADRRRFEAEEANRIQVLDNPGRYHPLVRKTRVALQGRANSRTDADRLNVAVDKSARARALRILDALIKGLERRGFGVRIRDGETLVTLGDVDLSIRLEERSRRQEVQVTHSWGTYRRYEFHPTGELSLKILDYQVGDVRKTWADGKRQKVEDCLNAFVVGLVAAAESKRRYIKAREEERRVQAERELAERSRKLNEAVQKRRVAKFVQWAEDWQQLRLLKRYLAAVRRATGPTPTKEVAQWLEWAEGYLNGRSVIPPVTDLVAEEERAVAELTAPVYSRW